MRSNTLRVQQYCTVERVEQQFNLERVAISPPPVKESDALRLPWPSYVPGVWADLDHAYVRVIHANVLRPPISTTGFLCFYCCAYLSLRGMIFNEGWGQEQAWDDGTLSYGHDEGATPQSQEEGTWFEGHAPEVRPRIGARVSRTIAAATRRSDPPSYRAELKHRPSRSMDAQAFPPPTT